MSQALHNANAWESKLVLNIRSWQHVGSTEPAWL